MVEWTSHEDTRELIGEVEEKLTPVLGHIWSKYGFWTQTEAILRLREVFDRIPPTSAETRLTREREEAKAKAASDS